MKYFMIFILGLYRVLCILYDILFDISVNGV